MGASVGLFWDADETRRRESMTSPIIVWIFDLIFSALPDILPSGLLPLASCLEALGYPVANVVTPSNTFPWPVASANPASTFYNCQDQSYLIAPLQSAIVH